MRVLKTPLIGLLLAIMFAEVAWAVPEVVSVRVTDVTPSSFAVVWMTDVVAEPEVEVYSDAAMSQRLSEGMTFDPMAAASPDVADAARNKGIMKVRISGLQANTAYYVRAVTREPGVPGSVGYSSLQEVNTAGTVTGYRYDNQGVPVSMVNDLLGFKVYVRPGDSSQVPGLGELIVLETGDASSPLSAFVGDGIAAAEGVLDLNNLFAADGASLDVVGGEKTLLRIYRGGMLSTLLHYRKFPADSGAGRVAEPVQGFFADFNMDGVVDVADFEIFKSHYRNEADDGGFNPDINLITVQEGVVVSDDRIDARDFARFATEFGSTNVE